MSASQEHRIFHFKSEVQVQTAYMPLTRTNTQGKGGILVCDAVRSPWRSPTFWRNIAAVSGAENTEVTFFSKALSVITTNQKSTAAVSPLNFQVSYIEPSSAIVVTSISTSPLTVSQLTWYRYQLLQTWRMVIKPNFWSPAASTFVLL